MKRAGKWREPFCLLLLFTILLCGTAAFLHKGEWWFPILYRLETREELSLVAASPPLSHCTLWTQEALLEQDNVSATRNLMLVNGEHPLPEGYEAELVLYRGARMHPLMRDDYIRLRDEIYRETGVRMYVVSDYRTSEEQQEILNSSEAGIAAKVGCSEHEAGLALDVYAPHFDGMELLDSLSGRMLSRLCCKHGYIIRYPAGKEEITGISYEPWHLRYVGRPHAALIMESGLTMEEYLEHLEVGQWYRTEEYLIARLPQDRLLIPDGWERCEISPDNMGNVTVTLRYADAQTLSNLLRNRSN